jgi:hypothetical protein
VRAAIVTALLATACVAWLFAERPTAPRDERAPAPREVATGTRDGRPRSAESEAAAAPAGQPVVAAGDAHAWHVGFVARDGAPAVPSPVQRLDGEERELLTPRDGVFAIAPEEATIVYGEHRWTIARPDTVIALPQLVPFVVELRDAESGAMLDAVPCGHADTETDVLPPHEVRSAAGVAAPGRERARLSRYAEAVRRVAPVWPEASITLRVRERDGAPAAATVLSAHFGRTAGGVRIATAHGRCEAGDGLSVRGVPMIDGELVTLRAGTHVRATQVEAVLRRGEALAVDVTLPEKSGASIGLGGGAGGAVSRGRGGRRATDFGALTVRAYRSDGTPAAGATLRLGANDTLTLRTDERGAASWPRVRAGRWRLELLEPGILYAAMTVEVLPGVANDAVIEEPGARSLDVYVFDHRGAPVASAEVAVEPAGELPYVLLIDGVQWIGHFTDARGMLRVGPLPPGAVRMGAMLGSRRAEAVAADGARAVEILLPPPAGD